MGGQPQTTAELEIMLKATEAKHKAAALLKTDPDCSILQAAVQSLKVKQEETERAWRSSKDPDDQMRGNYVRRTRLKGEVEALTTKMREAAAEEQQAAQRAGEFYDKIMSHNAEIERLKAEERRLQSEGVAETVTKAADMAKVVDQLKAGYVERFKDESTLPKEITDKKREIEALFTQMGTITASLSQLDAALQAAAMLHQEQTAEAAAAATAAAASAVSAAAEAKAGVPASSAEGQPVPGAQAGPPKPRPARPPPQLTLPASEGTVALVAVVEADRTAGKAVRDLTDGELLQRQAIRSKQRKTDAAAMDSDLANV